MAVNRKDSPPRRLAFGGRCFPRACSLAAALAVCVAFAQAHAEDAGLKNGAASLAAGKYDAAVRQLSATINSDNAARGDAAKAFYMRGLAYRKTGESARAIADLGAAIWLGLPESETLKALVNRGLAYKAAGLTREGDAQIATARKAGGNNTVDAIIAEGGGTNEGAAAIAAFSTEVRPEGQAAASASVGDQLAVRNEAAAPPTRTANASPTAWSTSVSDDQQPSSASSGNRLTRWFGSVTGSSSAPAPPPEPAPAPQAAAPPPKPAAPAPSTAAASSSWSTTTETQEASASASSAESGSRWSRLFNRSAEAEPQAQPAAAPSAAGGGLQLQLATSRSESEAKALWKKVSANVPGAQPQIEKVDIGNFGTFWSLRIGPFPDKAESLKVCNALKRSGIDCSPVTP
jgi:tetratricopeptide (TPR) repeat protein